MFGFDKEVPPTSEERFTVRETKWKSSELSMPRSRHAFWWVIHNSVAHPLLGIFRCKWTHTFHDWTSKKLNRLPEPPLAK